MILFRKPGKKLFPNQLCSADQLAELSEGRQEIQNVANIYCDDLSTIKNQNGKTKQLQMSIISVKSLLSGHPREVAN